MKTTELIEVLKTKDLTETEAYNLIIDDLYEFVTMEQVEAGQRLIAYFMYKIQSGCFAAITQLRKERRIAL
jgi:hypothetical protein